MLSLKRVGTSRVLLLSVVLLMVAMVITGCEMFMLTTALHDKRVIERQNVNLRERLKQAQLDKTAISSAAVVDGVPAALIDNEFAGNVGNFERLSLLGPDPKVAHVPTYTTATGTYPKSLMAVPVGEKGLQSGLVNALVGAFPRSHFTIVMFHFDHVDTSVYDWHEEVVHITAYGQMKWWFVKRFLPPALVAEYEFLFIWDDDLGVDGEGADGERGDAFDPLAYMELCRKHKLMLSTPAYDRNLTTKDSVWGLMRRKTNYESRPLRMTNFVEVSSPVIHTQAWPCVWSTLQNDLSSGWGYDLTWYQLCSESFAGHAGIVDLYPIAHRSGNSASGKSSFAERALAEEKAYVSRFPHSRVRPKSLASIHKKPHKKPI